MYVLVLANGLEFCWTVAGSERIPLVEVGGCYRVVDNRVSNLKLLDVLDAIMAERRAGTYPREGVRETSPRVEQAQVDMGEWEVHWIPMDWSVVGFSTYDINPDYYQRRIDDARRMLT
ncbi:MAG: hypothetical protein WCV84_05260 [Patescibacteria group bacterium]